MTVENKGERTYERHLWAREEDEMSLPLVKPQTGTTISESGNPPFKVSYFADFDELADASTKISQRYATSSITTFVMAVFLVFNTIVTPLLLLLQGAGTAALIVCLLNVLIASVFIKQTIKLDARRFFRRMHEEIGEQIVEVELSEEGISCRTDLDRLFYSWKSVVSIDESPKAIHLMLRASVLPIMKSGFAYREDERAFFEFAQEQVRRHQQRSLPE